MLKRIIRWFINSLDEDTSLEILRVIVESKKNKIDAIDLQALICKLRQ